MMARYQWRSNAKITAFFVLFFPLMIGLGFWQLDREAQKQALLQQQTRQQARPPAPVGDIDWTAGAALAYQPVRLSGRYRDDRSFLLDNRLREGRVGYEVLTPLVTEDGTVLVNRGWVPLGGSRQQLPELPAVSGTVTLTGRLHVPEGRPFLLSDRADPLGDRWPRRIQAIDPERMADALDRELRPYTVRIDPDQPGALVTDWTAAVIRPATHRGYALQWFTMAAVLLILFVHSSLTRKE